MAARGFMAGRRVLYAAPTQEQTDQFWEYQKRYFGDDIASGRIYKNEQRRILELGGGRVRAKTAWNADTMRGDYADLMFYEEFAMMHPSAWDEVGAPMLLDNDGDAVFISTPKRRNHFHKKYVQAVEDVTGRWEAWHFTSFDNPYLSQAALEEIVADMTEDGYKQEIMAEFLESQGAVFRNLAACLMDKELPRTEPKAHRNHHIVMGIDWGQKDFTAVSAGCVDCHVEVDIDRFNQLEYGYQRKILAGIRDKWHVRASLPERNSMGVPIIEELSKEGFKLLSGPDGKVGFFTGGDTKSQLIQNLALVFERAEWQFLDDPVWTAELEAYEQKISPTTGRSTYSAPEGLHDDTVIARALMVWAAGGYNPAPDKQPMQESKFLEEEVGEKSRWKRY